MFYSEEKTQTKMCIQVANHDNGDGVNSGSSYICVSMSLVKFFLSFSLLSTYPILVYYTRLIQCCRTLHENKTKQKKDAKL